MESVLIDSSSKKTPIMDEFDFEDEYFEEESEDGPEDELEEGTMVVLSLEQYAALTDEIELKLDEADKAAAISNVRYTEDEVFSRVRARINGEPEL